MENNDTNTDYHKFVRVGDQKWEIVEITIGIFFFFFCLRFVFTIFYTGSFQVPTKKNHPHLKCQFQPKIPIWPKSNMNIVKNGSALPPPPPSPRGNANYVLSTITIELPLWDFWMMIFCFEMFILLIDIVISVKRRQCYILSFCLYEI